MLYIFQFGVAVHEILHALGSWHEQQRADRDSNINVLYENIGAYKGQFQQRNTHDFGVEYDPASVMHYSARVGYAMNQGNRRLLNCFLIGYGRLQSPIFMMMRI